MHRDSGLLAMMCDDMIVRVVDVETRRIVRELGGCWGRVLDMVRFDLFLSACCHLTQASGRLSLQMLDG
jgi:hypothetical protein